MAVLQALQGLTLGRIFPLEGASVTLGRHPACDIVLESGSVSRQHARILNIDGDFYVEDLHSRNGTLLNGRPVVQRQLLAEDDELGICDLSFAFHRGPARRGDVAAAGSPRADHRRRDGRRRPRPGHFDDHVEAGRFVRLDGLAIGGQPRGEAEGADGDQPESRPGPGLGRGAAEAARQPVHDLPPGRPRLHRAPRSADGPAGAQGDQASPQRRRPNAAHQPHDRRQRDDEQGGDPLGRRRHRLAIRHGREHRRFPHPLDDLRAAGRQATAKPWA